jgi:hypothetical protein
MAAYTEGRQVVFQKIISLRGTMRIVTTDASLPHWRMFKLRLGYGIADILMAVKTEFVSRLQKNELILRGMGIVTSNTISLRRHFMNAFRVLGHNPFMALIADFVRILVQQLSMRGGMRIMTSCAFSRFHRGMHKLILEFLLKLIMATQAQLALSIGLEFEFILGVRNCDN